jgi:hypothetical protein
LADFLHDCRLDYAPYITDLFGFCTKHGLGGARLWSGPAMVALLPRRHPGCPGASIPVVRAFRAAMAVGRALWIPWIAEANAWEEQARGFHR